MHLSRSGGLPLLTTLLLALAAASATATPATVEDNMAQRMAACTLCHGKEGVAAPDGFRPRIAGKPAAYLYNQLVNFRDGRRHYGPMVRLMEPLSDRYLHEMAEHFASIDLPYPAPVVSALPQALLQRGEQLAMRGDAQGQLPACAECHGANLTGILPATPGLLGLPRDYLAAQLGAWQTGLRRAHEPDCMATVAKRLKPDDLAAVTAWLARQPVPAKAQAEPPPTRPLPMRCGSAVKPMP